MNYLYGQKGMKLKGFFRFESKVTVNKREHKKSKATSLCGRIMVEYLGKRISGTAF
ncbi:MAG: hypothetical protein WA421_19680 [Nitrososphaeraceae archaeon]